MNDPLQKAPPQRLSFLGWCLLLSTLANLGSVGVLLYLALNLSGYFNVYVTGGYVRTESSASAGDPISVKIVDIDRRVSPIEVKGTVSVDGEVSVKTDALTRLDVRVR